MALLDPLDSEVMTIEPSLSVDEVMTIYERVQFAKQETRRIEADLKEAMVEYIQANGPIEVGTKKYYVGDDKTTKCVNVASTVNAILSATYGDVGRLAELMSAQPFKHGACKMVLTADMHSQLFVTETKPKLKEGKAVKQLQVIDTQYLK